MGKVVFKNETTPATPSPGNTTLFVDSVDKNTKQIDDTGSVTDLTVAGVGGNFGTEFLQVSSEGESTTTSVTPIQKLRMTTGAGLPSANYKVMWTWELQRLTSGDAESKVDFNDGTELNWSSVESSVGSVYELFSGWKYVNMSGVNTFDIEYNTNSGTGSAKIRRARMKMWRIN